MQQTLFKFDPNLSDAPLGRGRYDGTLTDAQTRTSKAGNEMLELTIHVNGPFGNVVLRDWLVSTPRTKWKIKQFCKALGIDYARGEIDPEALRGKEVSVEVAVEEDRDGRDRNIITDYVVPTPVFKHDAAPGTPGAGEASGDGKAEGKNGSASAPAPGSHGRTEARANGRSNGHGEKARKERTAGAPRRTDAAAAAVLGDDEGEEIPF